jgi:hypothetical protein
VEGHPGLCAVFALTSMALSVGFNHCCLPANCYLNVLGAILARLGARCDVAHRDVARRDKVCKLDLKSTLFRCRTGFH